MLSISFHRWPSQVASELPDCELFKCEYADDQDNFYSNDQEKLVNIYEVRAQVFLVGLCLAVRVAHYY